MIVARSSGFDFSLFKEVAETEGIHLLVDKDKGWTSFNAVAKLRNRSKVKKVGHAGTLDPLATGLLILGFGKGTKTIDTFKLLDKEYMAKVRFGAVTATDDAEADEAEVVENYAIDEDELRNVLPAFTGEIQQLPPNFSAKRVNGKRAYELARKDKPVELRPASVTVNEIEILSISGFYAELRIACSKGTYIRSLARDIGKILGCGGYLSDLRRTKIGPYSVEDAYPVAELVERFDNENLS